MHVMLFNEAYVILLIIAVATVIWDIDIRGSCVPTNS